MRIGLDRIQPQAPRSQGIVRDERGRFARTEQAPSYFVAAIDAYRVPPDTSTEVSQIHAQIKPLEYKRRIPWAELELVVIILLLGVFAYCHV